MNADGEQDRPLLVFSGITGVLAHITGHYGFIFVVIFAIPWFGVFHRIFDKRDVSRTIMTMFKMAGVFLICGMLINLLRYVAQ